MRNLCPAAPVCSDLGEVSDDGTIKSPQTLYPSAEYPSAEAEMISTFSKKKVEKYPGPSTDCSAAGDQGPYAGCMTAPCPGPTITVDGKKLTKCTCPITKVAGKYQYGLPTKSNHCDDLGSDYVWSAANCSTDIAFCSSDGP